MIVTVWLIRQDGSVIGDPSPAVLRAEVSRVELSAVVPLPVSVVALADPVSGPAAVVVSPGSPAALARKAYCGADAGVRIDVSVHAGT